MPLTPTAIKNAFQDAMPHRRADFARRIKRLRLETLRADPFLTQYPADVLDLAETELRQRIELAASRVKQLINSGWTADPMNSVRKAFLDCFGFFDDMEKDPQSDLYRAVEAAFGYVQESDSPKRTKNYKRLSRVQVDTATACLSDLEVYYGERHPDTPAPSPESDKSAVVESVSQFTEAELQRKQAAFVNLLHPKVIEVSLRFYQSGDFREAVLNAVLALTDTIRKKSKQDGDGFELASKVFKPEAPVLMFSPMRTQSERAEHEGFHKLMLGAFQGIRNPKSHQLESDLNDTTAAQYLVFISLLVRRVDELRIRNGWSARQLRTHR